MIHFATATVHGTHIVCRDWRIRVGLTVRHSRHGGSGLERVSLLHGHFHDVMIRSWPFPRVTAPPGQFLPTMIPTRNTSVDILLFGTFYSGTLHPQCSTR